MNYDKTKYRKIDWKHFMMLHWIINPGLMINELILGQRTPKVMLMERAKDKSWADRAKIPCPHCEAIHDGKTWSPQNKTAFKNWFGLYCPNCGGIIPCLMNIGTFLVLLVTAPIWYWFKDSQKKKWLAKQPARYENLDLQTPTIKKNVWWKQGLSWGAMMFIFMSFFSYAEGEPLTTKRLIISAVTWTIGGLIFGLAMRGMTKQPKQKSIKQ